MALKTSTTVTRVDDLDGSTGSDVQTYRFTLDIELELSGANHETVKTYLADLARRGRKPAGRRTADKSDQRFFRKVRRWARDNGEPVKASGPPSAELIARYVAATGDSR